MSRSEIFRETYRFEPERRSATDSFFLKNVELASTPYFGEEADLKVETEPNVDGDYYVQVEIAYGGTEEVIFDDEFHDLLAGQAITNTITFDVPTANDDLGADGKFEIIVSGGEV